MQSCSCIVKGSFVGVKSEIIGDKHEINVYFPIGYKISEKEEHVRDEAILGLAQRVHVHGDAVFSSQFPKMQTAKVTNTLKNGMEIDEQVDFPKGEPENPMSDKEFEDFAGFLKFKPI